MNKSPKTIRPAARLLRTIGQDLIKDVYAAIVELVKNSYDADSPNVIINLSHDEKNSRLIIRVEDLGDGMSFDTVVNKWLVPATSDKLLRRKSNKGRVLQGRKGIGRFAAAVLGERILLETTADGATTSLILDMEELDNIVFLDELELNVDSVRTDNPNGTVIEIEKDNVSAVDVKSIWNSQQIRKLFVELRSLTAPEEVYQIASEQGFEIHHDPFEIMLSFGNFPLEDYSNRTIEIKPFPVLGLYDYKISGKIDSEGNGVFYFENQNIPSLPTEKIEIKIPLDLVADQRIPGDMFVDLRVYDRDPESISNIIERGLKDPETGDFVGKHEARKILDEYYGVGIYREQFRIRPYGEQGFDWLDLDKNRVQNPSFKIGHNQIIGFLYVRPEEISGLQEKSARDGLVENSYYYGLKTVVIQAIKELEVRRYQYREKAFRGGRQRSLDTEIDMLFDFDNTKILLAKEIGGIDVSKAQKESLKNAVNKVLDSEKKKKSEYAKRIRETIAVYQGQATLGKITHVLLHEGRKHIKYINETLPRINKWVSKSLNDLDEELYVKVKERSDKVIIHAKGLSFLFKRIEPLARTRRAPNKNLIFKEELEGVFDIFSEDILENNIEVVVESKDDNVILNANQVDFITVFSNLIENSIFWLSISNSSTKKIEVLYERHSDKILVEFLDSGPGFQGGNLGLMFEPGYSTKPSGTGLGLALVGEAINRMSGKIEAKSSENGAMFELTFKGVSNA